MAYVNQSVQRQMIADYIDVGTTETPSYVLMGTGFTTLDESPNAQVKESKYINNASSTKITSSYQAQFPFNFDMIASEIAIKKIYDIATQQKTGGDCEIPYVRVDLFQPSYALTTDTVIDSEKTYYTVSDGVYTAVGTPDVEDIGTYYEVVANTYRARKVQVSVEVSSISDSDGTLTGSGNLNQAGVMTEGTFDTSAKTFA
jgi:hypothetical protein